MSNTSTAYIAQRIVTKRLLFISFCAIALGCGKKKETPANADFDPLQISITKFQGNDSSQWKMNADGKLLTNLSTLDFEGVCGPKVVALVLKINGVAISTNPVCDDDSLWSYSGSLAGADGDTMVEVIGLDAEGNQGTDYLISKTVLKDTVAPTISGITAPFTDPQVVINAAVGVSGTLTGDVATMTCSDSSGTFSINTSGGTFTFTTFINEGETRTLTFRALDETGNVSAPVTQTFIRYGTYPSLSPPMAMYQLSGMTTVSGPVSNNGRDLMRIGFSPVGDSTMSSNGYDLTMGLIYQTTRY